MTYCDEGGVVKIICDYFTNSDYEIALESRAWIKDASDNSFRNYNDGLLFLRDPFY